MIGGGETPSRRFANQQVHPATVHWLTPDGEVGWIRFVGEVKAKAVASKGSLDIEAEITKTDNRPEVVEFILGFPGKAAPDLTATRWALPGLVVTVETNAGDMTLGSYYHYQKAQYALPPGQDSIRFSLRFELTE